MSLVLNTNIAALNATRNLSSTQNAQAQTFQRLSTGLRINSAKDDAAGLYLAQSQTKDIRGLGMATRNANDGISMAQTAEGALDQIGQNLQRINELAIQSANGTYSDAARGGLQKEVDQLTQEINRIVQTTEFNGKKLLSEDAESAVLQIGFNNDTNSRIETGLEKGLYGVDGLKNVTFFGAGKDFQGIAPDANGKTDNANVRLAFAQTLGMTKGDGSPIKAVGDLANTTKAGASIGNSVANALSAFQGDASSIGEALFAKYGDASPGVHKFTADGIEYTLHYTVSGTPPAVDALTDLKANYGGTEFEITLAALVDQTWDSKNTTAGTQIANLVLDTTDAATTGFDVKVEPSNALDAIINSGLNQTKAVDISTVAAAQNSITQTRTAIDQVSEIRATFGAVMNRFEAVISGNQIYSENLSAARSRIQDADFATETSNLAKQQVLQQAGISSLAQANQSSQAILGLL